MFVQNIFITSSSPFVPLGIFFFRNFLDFFRSPLPPPQFSFFMFVRDWLAICVSVFCVLYSFRGDSFSFIRVLHVELEEGASQLPPPVLVPPLNDSDAVHVVLAPGAFTLELWRADRVVFGASSDDSDVARRVHYRIAGAACCLRQLRATRTNLFFLIFLF